MKKITVSIGICIYNEGDNIKNLLNSLLAQSETNFRIIEIIILSDGSTDNGPQKIKEIKDRRIKLYQYRKRMGLAYRLNQVFKRAKGDYLVKIDGDVLPKDSNTFSNLFKLANKNVNLIGGNWVPINSRNFIVKIHNYGDYVWYLARKDLNNGNNIHNHNGKLSAMSRSLYKSIKIPTGYYGLDDMMFLRNVQLNGKFIFANDAVVFYKNPDTFADYYKQQRRFTGSREKLITFYGDWINKIYIIPPSFKYKASIIALIKNPVMFISFLIVHFIIQFKIKISGYNAPAYGWDITNTTKNISQIIK